MNTQLLVNAALIVVAVGWMGLRQLNWRPVELARMWRSPLILGAIGLVTLVNSSNLSHITTFDVGVLVFEIIISLAVGSALGVMAKFRPITAQGRAEAHDDGGATLESRTGWWGFALWVAFIVLRIGIDVGAGAMGSQIASSTAMILILLAANRVARSAVFAARIGRLTSVGV
ncbi:hypothetical protein [Subtercola lobariae]|uniref:DUF1453 domain-containing protein n=1 Tax=Subtercola lobariae TaxID=1588641 RepID=A0A917B3B1_9MICO|nr:hypothetical protein [Subtercola lobariae]GGF17127.1 hypothetical protein GCM10011399_08550 [Subtercola lobariae]